MSTLDRPPRVSVVIPCFNQAHFLGAAIESVRRQTAGPIELIVVDDGSSDDTRAVAARGGATVIAQAHAGLSDARNAGLAVVRAGHVIMLDADDELLPEAAAIGLETFAGAPDAVLVAGRCVPIDADGRVLPALYHDFQGRNVYREWLSRNIVWTPGAAMFDRDALRRAGGFPPGLGPVADYAVYLRLARTGRVVLHTRPVVRYRQHEGSMSRDPAMMLALTLDVLRRERAAAPHYAGDIRRARRAWRRWYGERIVHRLRLAWRAGPVGLREMEAGLFLLRQAPDVAVGHAARKLRQALAGTLRAVQGRILP